MKRLLSAGLAILVGLLGEIVLVDRLFPGISSSTRGKLMMATIVVLTVAAYFLFHERRPWVKRNGVLTYRYRDQLVSETYHARRALELRDLDAGDGWYLIELDTGAVLCLWDELPGGPLGFDPVNPDVRHFPCTEFTVLRHRTENFAAEVDCGGHLLKLTKLTLPPHYYDWLYAFLPSDGTVIGNKTLDELKSEAAKLCGSQAR